MRGREPVDPSCGKVFVVLRSLTARLYKPLS